MAACNAHPPAAPPLPQRLCLCFAPRHPLLRSTEDVPIAVTCYRALLHSPYSRGGSARGQPSAFSTRAGSPPLVRRASLDWLPGFRNGSDGGVPLEAAPSPAGGGLPGMPDGANNGTVQELVKITDCSWQLCAQVLEASGGDPQRCVHPIRAPLSEMCPFESNYRAPFRDEEPLGPSRCPHAAPLPCGL